jgi:adenylate kinase family enzyme
VSPRPTLIIVSGPAGSGKTTLAHAIASAVGCRPGLDQIVAFVNGPARARDGTDGA